MSTLYFPNFIFGDLDPPKFVQKWPILPKIKIDDVSREILSSQTKLSNFTTVVKMIIQKRITNI